ncbi:hypothetical protein [Alteromonas gracilis]|uniref:hypothetical protein n=1 Tax=Alteromonas gracilis TaxID=1479524 RepID=UPI003735495A
MTSSFKNNDTATSKKGTQFKFGHYSITLIDTIICSELSGLATPEALREYDKEIEKIILQLEGKPWGFLANIHGTGIVTPEAEGMLIKGVLRRKSMGMYASVIVAADTEIPALVQQQFARIYKASDVSYAFCSTKEEGIAWLKEQGKAKG